ncbi:HU family DNA-binding protein, partial [Turicimonas muris]
MNKSEMIEAIASECDISKASAQRALDAFTNNVLNALKKGDEVVLAG